MLKSFEALVGLCQAGRKRRAPEKAAALIVLGDKSAEQLTSRQRQVLQLLAEGKSMKEAGSILGITARTVAFHKYRMMDQLKITTSAELIRVAFQGHVV